MKNDCFNEVDCGSITPRNDDCLLNFLTELRFIKGKKMKKIIQFITFLFLFWQCDNTPLPPTGKIDIKNYYLSTNQSNNNTQNYANVTIAISNTGIFTIYQTIVTFEIKTNFRSYYKTFIYANDIKSYTTVYTSFSKALATNTTSEKIINVSIEKTPVFK